MIPSCIVRIQDFNKHPLEASICDCVIIEIEAKLKHQSNGVVRGVPGAPGVGVMVRG